jgi:hypothetical protein
MPVHLKDDLNIGGNYIIISGGIVMKKCLTVGIILLFIGTAIAPLNVQSANYAYPLNSNTHSVRENGTDFTVNISGQSFWMVIKMTFSQRANITFEHNGFFSYNQSKIGYFIETYSQGDFQNYINFLDIHCGWSDPEVYCHIGSLNWSFAHDNNQDFPDYGHEHFYGNIQGAIGSWYLIFISYATNRTLSVHIHANMSGSIAVERGDTVFALDRDNFLGGINIGWRRGVCIVNTQKILEIKHLFLGWFGVISRTGFYLLSYQMPNGTSQRLFGLDFLGHNINFTMPVLGPSGTWRFHATMMNIALLKFYPRVYLAGADIILPS